MSQPSNIVVDPGICGGKPTIKGTRVLVSVILDHLEHGASTNEILDGFPSITKQDIKACLTYARKIIEGMEFEYYSGIQCSQ